MKRKQLTALLTVLVMLCCMLPVQSLGESPLTLTFFDKNTGDAFDNPVAKKITELTGVTIQVQQPTGNPDEKLSLMLVSGDLPDIVLMDRRSDIVNKYIAAGALVPLNDLIDQYGPDVKAMYGDVLNKSRYEDGKNYYLNNWYGVDPDPDRGILLRMDVLQELGYGERAAQGDYFTQAEFVDMLKKFKETQGDSAIPFTINGEYMETVMSTFRGMYGLKGYYENEGKLLLEVRDPKYLEMVKFINQLYRDGLLDKEWAINNADLMKQKLISGSVMACNGGIPDEVNTLFQQEIGQETNQQFYMFRVVADGTDPTQTTFSPRSSLGWDAIGITVKNQHPEETMKFINFLASEEGQYLLMWGVEGQHWEYVDGVHTPHEDIIPAFRKDWGEASKQTGIRKWSWFIKNGFGTDGTPYDLVGKYDVSAAMAHARISMVGSVYDTALYDNIGPAGGTMEALMEQKLKDIMTQGFSKMAFAASEEEVESVYADMMNQLDANGASTVEQIYTDNYQSRLTLWGE